MNYTLKSDIPYLPNPHARHHLDLYIPSSDSKAHPSPPSYPLIIYIHGGAFKFGDKTTSLLPLRLLSSYALASLNYRLSGHATFPAALQDCNAAVRFLRSNATTFSLDPARFVVMGESAGGYLACMTGIPTGPSRPHDFIHPDAPPDVDDTVLGVIDFYGPTDFTQMDAHAPEGTPHVHNAPDSPESLFLGHQITQVPALVQKANPVVYVDEKTMPAVLVAHGTADGVVPFHQSLLLERRLKKVGRDVTFWAGEGLGHVWEGISEVQRAELDGVADGWLLKVFGK